MRKIFLTFIFIFVGTGAFALDVAESFTYSNSFWQNSISASQSLNYFMSIGLNFDLTEHDDVANHIYTFSLPMLIRSDNFGLIFTPFIMPDNANDASAKGAKLSCSFGMKYDELEQTSSHAFLSVGFADQNAYVQKKGELPQKDNFYQLAYEGGLVFNYFDVYLFEISGNIFQYPSGISSVETFGGILDQQNISSLQTLDYIYALPRGSAGLKIGWNSQESRSENTLSYRFIEFYEKDIPAYHSLQFQSSIIITNRLSVILGYNHIFISSKKDRDIFKGVISFKF